MKTLLVAAADLVGEWSKELPNRQGAGNQVVQVSIPAGITGTVKLYGRLSPEHEPVEIMAVTATALQPTIYLPYMQAVAEGVSQTDAEAMIRVGVL